MWATFALAMPMNDSGPVRSVMTPTLMGSVFGLIAIPSGLDGALEAQRVRLDEVPGVLHDRRDRRVGHERVPTCVVPVERDPHAVGGRVVAEDERTLAAVLRALLGAHGAEHGPEPVPVCELGRCEDHGVLPFSRMVNTSDPSPVDAPAASGELPIRQASVDETVVNRPPRRIDPVGGADLRVEVLDVTVGGLR